MSGSVWRRVAGLPRRLLTSDTGRVTLGNAAAAGMGFAVLVVLSHGLGAAGFGALAPFLSLIDIGQLLIDTILATGVVTVAARAARQGRVAEADALKAGFWLRAGAGGLFALGVAGFADPLAHALGLGEAAVGLIRLAGLAGGVLVVVTAAIGGLQVEGRFAALAFGVTLKNLTRLMALLLLLVLGLLTPEAAAIGLALAAVATAAGLLLLWRPGPPARPGIDWAVVGEMLRVNRWMAVASVSVIAGRLDILLLTRFGTAEETAFYAAAMQLCIVVGVLSQAFVTTALPRVSRFADMGEVRGFLRSWARAAPLALVPLAFMLLASDWLVPLLLGPDFARAAPVLDLLFASALIALVMNPVLLLLFPLGELRVFGLASLAQVSLKVVIAVLVIPAYGAVGVGWADIGTKALTVVAILAIILIRLRRGGPLTDTPLPGADR